MFYLGEHELRLIGSMMYRHEDYLTAIDYVSKGIVNLKPLVSNRFAFEEYDDAYKFIDAHHETSMKVLIDFEQKPGEDVKDRREEKKHTANDCRNWKRLRERLQKV